MRLDGRRYGQPEDGSSLSAVVALVEVADKAYLYFGFVQDVWLDANKQPLHLQLFNMARLPFERAVSGEGQPPPVDPLEGEGWDVIPGDSLLVPISEIKNLDVYHLTFEVEEEHEHEEAGGEEADEGEEVGEE